MTKQQSCSIVNTHASTTSDKIDHSLTSSNRTCSQWIDELEGTKGDAAQHGALSDLANYLFIVLLRYIQKRRLTLLRLSTADDHELVAITQDLVQSFMAKLIQNNFHLLSKYDSRGHFTSWAAQVAVNLARNEFRRVKWDREYHLELDLMRLEVFSDKDALSAEAAAWRLMMKKTVIACLHSLPEYHQTVLIRCVINNEPAVEVAADLERSVQAVYNLIYRAKHKLAERLATEGIDSDSLGLIGP